MSEHLAAEIFIGGTLASQHVPAFCTVIDQADVRLEWGDGRYRPQSAHDLRGGRTEQEGVAVLRLCDDSAPWGRFEALEAFCVRHRLPFRRYTEGKWEYDPELVVYRPGTAPIVIPTNASRVPVVPAAEVRDAFDQLTVAETYLDANDQRRGNKAVRQALALLEDLLPAKLPPLPPFRVGRTSPPRRKRVTLSHGAL